MMNREKWVLSLKCVDGERRVEQRKAGNMMEWYVKQKRSYLDQVDAIKQETESSWHSVGTDDQAGW